MNQENSKSKVSRDEIKPGIPIQPGLFEYPVPEGLAPALLANRCTNCEKTFFPKRSLCPYCFDKGKLKDITLDRHGVIYAVTTVHVPSPTGIKAPYVYGYVDIHNDNLRVFTLFAGDDINAFVPGQEVELFLEPIKIDKNGTPVIGYKYRITPMP